MAYQKSVIKQRDVTRIAKGMRDADIEDWEVKIELPDGGKISIFVGKSSGTAGRDDFDTMIRRLP